MSRDVQAEIKETVEKSPVVLYMKGTAYAPMCGFSGHAIEILKACGLKDFVTVDVLSDQDIRAGIKEYSSWPTVPQLYVKGEFVGGCDIMREMYQAGELQQQLAEFATAAS